MPNPHDLGTARLLGALGFPAIATTSSGFAASLGRADMHVARDELVAHVALLAEVGLPLNVDAEACFPHEPGGVTRTVALLAEAGASGCSIEDWDPGDGAILPMEVAVSRVTEAAQAAEARGILLTARCEHHIRGVDDFAATVERLRAYEAAGARCLYAPGLTDLGQIGELVAGLRSPVNVLLVPGGPSVAELARVGVRRCSTGGALAWAAYGAAVRAATRLLEQGRLDAEDLRFDRDLAGRAFTPLRPRS